MRARCAVLIMACGLIMSVLLGCARETYAPVSDRTPRATGEIRDGTYEVVRGDTLYSIAFRVGVDHRDLARWNRISAPYTIYPGQRLRLTPPPSGGVATATSPAPVQAQRQTASRPTAAARSGPATSPRAQPRSNDAAPSSWVWPAEGEVVKAFAPDPDGKQGINIAGRDGDPIKAAASGRVVYSGSGLIGYGNLIIIKHSGDYLTAYGYNRELLVREGDEVRQGQTIARMGRSGGRALLHFELRQDGRPVDPLRYLP